MASDPIDERGDTGPDGAGIGSTARYVAVIFTSQRTDADPDAYEVESDRMADLAAEQPGYRGIESARTPDGFGITVSYWASEEDARAWKRNSEHLVAQRDGRDRWYAWYRVRVATVEREYSYDRGHVSEHVDTEHVDTEHVDTEAATAGAGEAP